VLRTRGAETAREQPFLALAELCRPLLGQRAQLPDERSASFAAALGLDGAARTVDRYAVYVGMLDVLTAAAEDIPILVVIDDAHLLDEASAEAIPLIAPRLRIDGIALVIATESDDALTDVEELRLGGLDPAHARSLLFARFGDQLAPTVAERIVDAARGPLALIEMACDLTPAQRGGRAPLDPSLPPSAEWIYLRRIEALSPDTRWALLIAALAEDGHLGTVERACDILALDASVLGPAERAGLLRMQGTRVTFCHELARTAVSYSALAAERRLAHSALGGAADDERRLWHQARASTGPDDAVAEGLEKAATSARSRSLRRGSKRVRAGGSPHLRS
jgi:hypothetical protein